jgi:endonuclease/exonuclease/phosphatase family metal-dependent hydrolase
MPGLLVATLNIHGNKDRWFERRELIVSEIVDLQPDIIGLQEIYRPLGQARWLRNQVNSRIIGRSKGLYHLVQRRKRQLISGCFEGIAILSKLPVVSSDYLALGEGGYLALRVNVELPTRETLDFVTLQLDTNRFSKETRLEQVLKLQGWLHGRDMTPAHIIAGDFSDTPEGLAIQQMKQVYRSTFEEVMGTDPIATYPTGLLSTRHESSRCLDYIFLSSIVGKVVQAKFFCNRPSSHDLTLYPSNHVGLVSEISLHD